MPRGPPPPGRRASALPAAPALPSAGSGAEPDRPGPPPLLWKPARPAPTCPGAAAAMKAASGKQLALAAEKAGSDVRGEAAGGGQPCERGGPPARRRGPPHRPPPVEASVPLPAPMPPPPGCPLGEAEPFPPQHPTDPLRPPCLAVPRLPRHHAPHHGRGVGTALSGRDAPAAMRCPNHSSAPWRSLSARTYPWRPPPYAALPWVVRRGER